MSEIKEKSTEKHVPPGIPEEMESGLAEIEAGLKGDDFDPLGSDVVDNERNTEKKNKAPSYDEAIAAQIGQTLFMLSAVMANNRGDHWLLGEVEAVEIGKAGAMVIEKYMPSLDSGPEWLLVVALGAPLLSRIVIDKQLASEKRESATIKGEASNVGVHAAKATQKEADVQVPASGLGLGGIDGY